MKNCFRLVAGDDLMTATIANCNPNGSSYLWYISEATRRDMSGELRAKLDAYDGDYDYYNKRHATSIPTTLANQYNALVTKYRAYRPTLKYIGTSIVGYAALMEAYYEAIDFETLLRHDLMPTPTMTETTAATEDTPMEAKKTSPPSSPRDSS